MLEWIDENPPPVDRTDIDAGLAWSAEWREVQRAWLDAAPDDIREAAEADSPAASGSRVIAEREAAEEASAKVTAWGRDVCGLDGL